MVIGVEQIYLNPNFFPIILVKWWPGVIYDKYNVSEECGVFSLKIFINRLQLLSVQVYIECLIVV